MHAQFICLEGVAGAGKTTQVKLLADQFQKLGKNVHVTKAFEGKRRQAAENFMEALEPHLKSTGIMFVFQALHTVQKQEVIEARANNDYIIADRWRETFFAYHNYHGPLAAESATSRQLLDDLAFGSLNPDVTILLNLPPALAKQRYETREDGRKRLDTYNLAFFESTVQHYQEAALEKGWPIIDASQSIEQVHRDIKIALKI